MFEFGVAGIRLCARGKVYSINVQGNPEEVFTGHGNRYIAHRRWKGSHLVRAIYEYEGDTPVLVTVYFPYAERYFQGGKIFEDKILERR